MRRLMETAVVGISLSAGLVLSAGQVAPGVATNAEVPPVMLTVPTIAAAPGVTATLVVPPGTMYDPLSVLPRPGRTLWINDDGGVSGPRGGYVWTVDRRGRTGVLIDANRMMPSTGMDIAPKGFGSWGGQLFTLSTVTVERIGVQKSHIIERVPPTGPTSSTTVCTLPDHGTVAGGAGAAGIEARFGPAGSPFANRFFSITIANNTIYQTTADGACRPFATFDGSPWGLAFTADGSRMLVTVRKGASGLGGRATAGVVVAVRPDGAIDPQPVFAGASTGIFDVEVAPKSFPRFAGQIFYTDWGPFGPDDLTKPPAWDGALYRVGPDGQAHLVASGFSNPAGIAFADSSIWVADVNRDGPFYQRKWVADGFVVRLDVARGR